jgi:hypothetical protein
VTGLAIYCADVGSIKQGNFGWARADVPALELERHHGNTEIIELVDALDEDLTNGVRVTLGFECPLVVPVPSEALRLGSARAGDGTRAWSAGAGTGALATGLVQAAWVLAELRARQPDKHVHLDWEAFADAEPGLFLWEAFVTDRAKATTHVDDASIAVACFVEALPDPRKANAVVAERPLSLIGAAAAWAGWSDDVDLLCAPCLVLKASAVI